MRTGVVVVGGGPAGMMLTYLLARAGVDVTLLESRGDFKRRFRGDTVAPAVLDYLDELGLADELLAEVPHARAEAFQWHTPSRTFRLADYRSASRRFGFYALIPQQLFLAWLSAKATAYPNCRVLMQARVNGLLRDASGRVVGVGYSDDATNAHELNSDLVVAADGRSSKVRALSGLVATELGANLDMLWYELPRLSQDPDLSGLDIFTGPGAMVALLNQVDHWQLGYTIPAGTFAKVRSSGVEPIKQAVIDTLPWLAERLSGLADVSELSLLPVRITSVARWWDPGLLLIGDAAHVISPVGGNGINYAIADAAESANRLITALTGNTQDQLTVAERIDRVLPEVEQVRRPPVERAQRLQVRIERDTRARLERRTADAPMFFKVQAAIPGFAAFAGRRGQISVASPHPALR